MNVTDSIKGWIKHPFVKNVTDLANRPLVARVTKFVSGDDNTLGDWVNKARDLHNFLASGRIEQSLRAECNKILREYKGEIDLIEKGLSLYSLIQGKPNTNADGTVLQHEKPKQLLDILVHAQHFYLKSVTNFSYNTRKPNVNALHIYKFVAK